MNSEIGPGITILGEFNKAVAAGDARYNTTRESFIRNAKTSKYEAELAPGKMGTHNPK
jgi:hypothetical protein